MNTRIAVTGMACCFPDADSPQQLWENVLAGRRAFRRIPSERLSLADYYSTNPLAIDSIYAREAAVIEGYAFDRVKFNVAGSTFRAADWAHWLALDVASRALDDAGFPAGVGLPTESTGVIVGNTLTGEFSRANTLRLRWPYVRRTVDGQLRQLNWEDAARIAFLTTLESAYKAPFPSVGEETLAGGLSNTIAGRICNQFQFHGGGFTVDGACSSSLLAVAQACSALAAGDLDAALVGGVDLSLDPFELVGFARTGALTHSMMRVFDRNADGFLPGEGAGFVVLMRHEDALARGSKVHALIRGWGVSSDGGGGITRPETQGQRLALERAYRRAGFGIDSVALFEGHGTGTAVGDEVELRTLSAARRAQIEGVPPAIISSVKANIGHTKAAAGIAGFIKATMAIRRQILPPATGINHPHDLLMGESRRLQVLQQGMLWPKPLALRAGVSAFGFGGINVHVALEGAGTRRRNWLAPNELSILSSHQDAELFLFGAANAADLEAQITHLMGLAERLSYAELGDLAVCLSAQTGEQRAHAAIVASTPSELYEGLLALTKALTARKTRYLDTASGVFLGIESPPVKIAFLFPGQASPVRLNGGILARRFPEIERIYAHIGLPNHANVTSTAVAQPAIVAAELAGLQLLDRLGIKATVAVGHSLGELTALHWGGAFDEQTLLRMARTRGTLMADVAGPRGAMASVAASPSTVNQFLGNQDAIVISGLNSPRQTTIAGEVEAIARAITQFKANGIVATLLPVSHAFHSPHMAAAAEAWAQHLSSEQFHPVFGRVVSTVHGGKIGATEDLRALLKHQLTLPVRFSEALHDALDGVDLCIEVGPGHVLTGLTHECTDTPVISLDASGTSLRGLLDCAGAAHALGVTLNRSTFFSNRLHRPYDFNWTPTFFANPCELAPHYAQDSESLDTPTTSAPLMPAVTPSNSQESPSDALELVRTLVAQRAELPVAGIKDDSRLLVDLHLNSITVSQLVVDAALKLGLPPPVSPTDYADATVAQVADALRELAAAGHTLQDDVPHTVPGIDAWVRPFLLDYVELSIPPPRRQPEAQSDWQLFASQGHPLATPLLSALQDFGGRGVAVCLSPEPQADHATLLLKAAKCALNQNQSPQIFVLLQHGASAASFAKTLFLEAPNIDVCIVDAPLDPASVDKVVQEVRALDRFSEVYYDASGCRREPRLRLLTMAQNPGPLPLGRDDVLLVSGGGKGIAAECAAALALESGARLALLGRTHPNNDPALAANLERFAAKGITFRYLVADVTDTEAVAKTVRQFEAELGPITAIIHGAGINRPNLLRQLDDAACHETLSTKLNGARNLIAAVNTHQLRLLVTFSSIIGRTGLRGEADYALANERLTQLTEDFQRNTPSCRCLALEWSVWSGVGMGERLGRIDALVREGITPISPDVGIKLLLQLLRQPFSRVGVVITGRFGHTPTLTQNRPALPFLRFLEEIQVYYPGVELISSAELSITSDPYVDDHIFQGEYLFPAVMGLEAMAQVAMAVTGENQPPGFEDVEFIHPIVIPRDRPTTLRIVALVDSDGSVQVAIRSSATAYQSDHFRARCRVGACEDIRSVVQLPAVNMKHIDIDVDQDIYGKLLFHTGRFRRLSAYQHLSASYCCADITRLDSPAWFARYLPTDLVLDDPASRDAALHAIQACIPHGVVLPTAVERWTPGAIHAPGPWTVHAHERWHQGDEFCYDLDVLSHDGRLRERWQGLRLRKVATAPTDQAWGTNLLGAYVERRIQELLPNSTISIALEFDTLTERRSRSDSAARLALDLNVRIWRRPDGKPETLNDRTISTAHSGALTLAVAGHTPLACDIETVLAQPDETMQRLLGAEGFALATRVSEERNEPIAAANLRVWSAQECIKKAGLAATTPITLIRCHPDNWVVFGAGNATIVTYSAKLKGRDHVTLLAILSTKTAEILPISIASDLLRSNALEKRPILLNQRLSS